MTHELKSWPQFFEFMEAGDKTFEVRRNDRQFSRGDVLHLREWVPADGAHSAVGEYTGREMRFKVTYLMRGHEENRIFGLEAGYVIMGVKRL